VTEFKEGLAARGLAVEALAAVLSGSISYDDFLEASAGAKALEPRDRSFLSAIVLTTLRHKEQVDAVIGRFITKPLPRKSGATAPILQSAAAQLLFLDAPAYAVIDVAVQLAKADRDAMHFTGLINAVLRKVAAEGRTRLPGPRTAAWLQARWVKSYGGKVAARIAAASLQQAALDITVKEDAAEWAKLLGGALLPTGTVRIESPAAAVEDLPGFSAGAWWVQDAASAVPARLLSDIAGKHVLDLCAAPGGKTLQLAAQKAQVTAVDQSAKRLDRLRENLARTGLSAEIVCCDVLSFAPAHSYDAVLLDAPCTATGTIRRHPDLPYVKSAAQIGELVILQRKMLTRAAAFVKPGGALVYCTCSLEPEEGEGQMSRFLGKYPEFAVEPIVAGEAGLGSHMITPDGWFRSLPHMAIGASTGLDGFFAARLRKRPR